MRDAKLIWLLFIFINPMAFSANGNELLTGTITDSSHNLHFALSGESRENVVGGTIRLNDKTFAITHISRLGTIGARRDDSDAKEFAVFSSSFNEQTATGQPWVASNEYIGCVEPYNSFLALYRVEDEKKLQVLGDIPYADLTNDLIHSIKSAVYCFISRPPSQ
jgi:hypothetical protein